MGGPCDAEMMANTPEEIMQLGMAHLDAATDDEHTKLKEEMKTSTEEAKQAWQKTFMATWESTPDNV